MLRKKYLILILGLVIVATLAAAADVFALTWADVGTGYQATAQRSGFNTANPPSITTYVAGIITALLTLVGAIFISMFIYGGVKWMTSGGNSDKIKEAQRTLIFSVVGVVIIMGAYGIAYFVAAGVSGSSTSSTSGNINPQDECPGDCYPDYDACVNAGGSPITDFTSAAAQACGSGVCCTGVF